MGVLKFPTKKERLLKFVRDQIDSALQVIDEPMRSEAVDDIVKCAEKYMPDDPTVLSITCAPLTAEQQEAVNKGVEDMLEGISTKFAAMLMEFALIRVNKATCQMMHWDQ